MPDQVLRDVYVDGVELARLQRALELQAEPLGNRRYRVTGHAEPHYVDLRDRNHRCDCGDVAWRHDPPRKTLRCKHELRARLAEGERSLLRIVGFLVGLMAVRIHAMEKVARPAPLRVTRRIRTLVAERTGVPVEELAFQRGTDRSDPTVSVHWTSDQRLLGTLVPGSAGPEFIPAAAGPEIAPAAPRALAA